MKSVKAKKVLGRTLKVALSSLAIKKMKVIIATTSILIPLIVLGIFIFSKITSDKKPALKINVVSDNWFMGKIHNHDLEYKKSSIEFKNERTVIVRDVGFHVKLLHKMKINSSSDFFFIKYENCTECEPTRYLRIYNPRDEKYLDLLLPGTVFGTDASTLESMPYKKVKVFYGKCADLEEQVIIYSVDSRDIDVKTLGTENKKFESKFTLGEWKRSVKLIRYTNNGFSKEPTDFNEENLPENCYPIKGRDSSQYI